MLPRRLHIQLFAILIAVGAGLLFLPSLSPQPASAAKCGPTTPGDPTGETNSKLQIFVNGPHADQTNWAFFISPNPFTFTGTLRVVDNSSADLNKSSNDILLEDVCTTTTNEQYTVSVDPAVSVVCPLDQTSITRGAPGPTVIGADPETSAFYFTQLCPTPTPSPTPSPTATPIATATATPAPVIVTIQIIPGGPGSPNGGTAAGTNVSIPCNQPATVTFTAKRGGVNVPDGTQVTLTTSYGTLANPTGPTSGGSYSTQLTVPQANAAINGIVNGTALSTTAQTGFTVAAACVSDTLTIIRPPNTGDGGIR